MSEEHKENELIERLVNGDEPAFKELVETYQDRIFNVCLSFLPNREDAQDTTQEVFIEVHRSLTKFQQGSQLYTWIYRIAVNKSLELIRKRKRKKRFAFLTELNTRTEETIGGQGIDHPGYALEQHERVALLYTALDKLPEKQRLALTLYEFEHKTYKEICEIMNTSLSSIESLIFRAKRNLKKHLTDHYEQGAL